MKTVLLFRHAKSDWGAVYGRDHDRPLAKRGRKASVVMGRWLTSQGVVPEMILCSTATRARQTLSRAAKAGKWNAITSYHGSLYGAMPETLLEHIQEQDDDHSVVMLVGHQPAWSMTTSLLAGSECGRFPTATMACVDIPVNSWVEVIFGTGKLRWIQRPKELSS